MPRSLYVPMYPLPDTLPEGTIPMLDGDIEGTHPAFHKLHKGSTKNVPSCSGPARVLFLPWGQSGRLSRPSPHRRL